METIDNTTTAELVRELTQRIKNTNGLEFCPNNDLIDLIEALDAHLFSGGVLPPFPGFAASED